MKIGVLGIQGAVKEHMDMLSSLGVTPVKVRKPADLEELSALIIPGGESTTIARLMEKFDLINPIIELYRSGNPIMGTCAGLVLLADHIEEEGQGPLGLLNVEVKRNGFGRQVNSFEAMLNITELGEEPLNSVFIRAPYIVSHGENVEVMASYQDKIVAVRQDNILAASFHPELTDDTRLHELFLNMTKEG